jgi:Protein of unknown function (DUF1329)
MAHLRSSVIGVVIIALATTFGLTAGRVAAQDLGTYSQVLIDGMAAASSPETLPVSTKITTANWQQYRKFEPIGMQAFLSGQYFWRLGAGSEDYIEVGPTIPTALPTKYLQDTEKYAGQAQLVKLPSGAYTIRNYSAGIPFPHPTEPDMGGKLLYNYYYTYIPSMYHAYYPLEIVDRYFNISENLGQQVFFKLSHVSDAGQPINNPSANGIYLSLYDQGIEPEQNKYLTSLAVFPDDPQRVPELYVFLPSLRRSLRLSSAARCAPLQGTDWTNDDQRGGFSGIPDWFIPRYLGEKKVLFLVHAPWLARANEKEKFGGGYTYDGHSFGWAKPQENKFELRDVYLLDLVPTEENSRGYCYSHRLLYIDKQLAYTADQADTWDKLGKLWKLQIIFRGPTTAIPSDLNGQKSFVMPSGGEIGVIYDIQNGHMNVAWPSSPSQINSVVPGEFHNLALYALPSGLSQIVK